MSGGRHPAAPLAIGVDAGGTQVRIQALRAGRPVTRLALRATPNLDRLLALAWRRQGWERDGVAALVAAVRGVWTARERQALARRLHRLARRVRVRSDAEAALLGALADAPGLLILAGTGAIVIGRAAPGRWARAGGLGPLLGDEGSAFWIGREWLRARSAGRGLRAARRLGRAPDAVLRIAALAPRVLARARRGDRQARAIVAEAQRRLATLALGVARRLRLRPPVRVSWAGGLAGDAGFRAGLRRAVARGGLRARWQAPRRAPVEAAACLAVRLAGGDRARVSALARRRSAAAAPAPTPRSDARRPR